jgi:hypothetical protein
MGSQNGVNALKSQWNNADMQNTLEHVKKSFGANADLSGSVSMPSHGWTERDRRAKESNTTKGGETTEDVGTVLTDEDISRIVVEFCKTYPNIKLETQDDNRSISVWTSHQLLASCANKCGRRSLCPDRSC